MTKETDRLLEKKIGVFNHFLYRLQNNPQECNNLGRGITDWNELVENFDVEKLAYELHKMGVGYYFITLMQGSSHMIAPNKTFDKIAGTLPGKACSVRDLPMDLYNELSKYDIDLYLYYTGDGPWTDESGKKFGYFDPRGDVTEEFVQKWAAVLEEYAVRYGDKVKGWWIDGCYRKYFGYTDNLLKYYYDACKKGNPNCIVAMNDGICENLTKNYENEDFVCGEYNSFSTLPKGRWIDGAQAHILAPLGHHASFEEGAWGQPGLKHSKEYMLDFVKKANALGAAVTIDIALYTDTTFDPAQTELIQYVTERL